MWSKKIDMKEFTQHSDVFVSEIWRAAKSVGDLFGSFQVSVTQTQTLDQGHDELRSCLCFLLLMLEVILSQPSSHVELRREERKQKGCDHGHRIILLRGAQPPDTSNSWGLSSRNSYQPTLPFKKYCCHQDVSFRLPKLALLICLPWTWLYNWR